MKTIILSAFSLLLSVPSAFAIPYNFPISIEDVGEDFQITLDQALQNAKDRCAEENDEFTFSCVLLPERSLEIRTVFKDTEAQPGYRSRYETTVKGQFTCQCNMAW